MIYTLYRIKKYWALLFITALPVVAYSCKNEQNASNDISEYDKSVNLQIKRFDKAYFNIDTSQDLIPQFEKLNAEYNGALDLLITGIYGLQNVNEPLARKFYRQTRLNPFADSLYKDVFAAFNEQTVKSLEKKLADIVARHNSVYPGAIPSFISMVTFFNLDVDTFRNNIVLGLDMFLGNGYRYYVGNQNLPNYVVKRLDRAYLPARVARKLYERENRNLKATTFLDYLITSGKRIYYQKALVTDVQDTVLFELSAKELAWNKENESHIWNNILSKNALYIGNEKKFSGYFVESPFTNADGVPQESSPRLGDWLGYRIVSAYMARMGASLKELLTEKDSKKILTKSRYRP